MVRLLRPEGSKPEDFNLSRRALGGLLFAGYALGAGPLRAETIHTDETGLIAKAVEIPSGDVKLPAYIAMPENARKRPVIIVVSEVFGLHEYIRDVVRRLAKQGFVAVAPDLFVRAGDPAPLTDFGAIRKIVETATDAQVMGDLRATLDWLATDPDLGQKRGLFKVPFADMKRVGITGFCWGGAVVWMAVAEEPRIKTGVAWYGRLSRPKVNEFLGGEPRGWPLEVVDRLHGPVLGLYAGQDKGIPVTDVEKMRSALHAKGDNMSELIVYPEAQHGFHADYRETFDPNAAADGWKRLLDWFHQRL